MAAKDIFHDAVKRALQKEDWLITNDPLFLRFSGLDMYIDLGAEKVLAAERNQEKIAVEVKSFVAPSTTTEFSTALGQYLRYQLALEEEQPERLLYFNTVQLALKTLNSVGWGATALGGFPDLEHVAFEERNPTFTRLCWVALCLTQPTIFLALEEEQPERLLYLAVPLDTYRSFFTLELPRLLIQRYQVRLIVFDPEEEAIVKWQK